MSEASPLRMPPGKLPVRTAEIQLALAGADSCLLSLVEPGRALVSGKGGDCVMTLDQWTRYTLLAREWQQAPKDAADGDAGLMQPRPRTPWERAFASLDRLVLAGKQALAAGDLEELEDVLETLGRESRDLGEAVTRAEQIIRQGGPQGA